MNVEKATIQQTNEISSLFDAYRVFYKKESNLNAATSFIKERLEKQDSIIYYIKNEQEEICGFTQLYPSFSSTKMKRLWILNDLYVQSEDRGKGYSKALINRVKKLCKETEACGILLETETSNTIGNQLYPATGFELESNNFYFWSTE